MTRMIVALAFVTLTAGVALAQMGPGSGYRAPPPQTAPNPQPSIPDQSQTHKNGPAKAKAAPSKEDVLRDVSSLVKSVPLPCDVSDAAQLNEGTATINGQQVHVRTFEVACSNGMGYFLVDQPPQAPTGFSCFAAEHTRDIDKAQGRQPGPACSLPANANLKTMAGAVLSKLGDQCQVTAIRTIGVESAAHNELTEAACSGGTGYVIASALPGSTTPPSALTCPDSYKRGVPCTLSSNGAPLITMDTFKEALAQHNVPCNVENSRLIGKENVKQRHVVEFKCPQQQPDGLVAFIPLSGSTAPFETMDCSKAASKFRIICTLTPAR